MKKKTIIVIIALVITFLLLIVYLLYNNIYVDSSDDDIETRIKEIMDDSYKFYLLLNGNLPITEQTIQYENDDIRYNLVNIEGINSTSDINVLINSLFSKNARTGKFNEFISTGRNFVSNDNGLYVNFDKEDICDLSQYGDIFDYIYKKVDDTSIIVSTVLGDTMLVYEEDNWYLLYDNIYICEKENQTK